MLGRDCKGLGRSNSEMKKQKKARTASARNKRLKRKPAIKSKPKPQKQKRKKRGAYKLRMNAASIRAAGMLVPEAIDLEGTTLHKLTKQWYKLLKDDGHDDIEWQGGSVDSCGTGSPFLKRPDQTRIKYAKVNSYEYYRLCTCFLTHRGRRWPKKGDKLIWAMHTDGTPYRDIQRLFNAKAKRKISLFYVFTRIKELTAEMLEWHKVHPEGLRNGREDFHVDDVLLREPDPVPKAD